MKKQSSKKWVCARTHALYNWYIRDGENVRIHHFLFNEPDTHTHTHWHRVVVERKRAHTNVPNDNKYRNERPKTEPRTAPMINRHWIVNGKCEREANDTHTHKYTIYQRENRTSERQSDEQKLNVNATAAEAARAAKAATTSATNTETEKKTKHLFKHAC